MTAEPVGRPMWCPDPLRQRAADHPKDTLEPDVLLVTAGAVRTSHYFTPDRVMLVAEVVSPGTRRRDRLEKPADYAAAGIAHYWRVEQDPLHVFAYALDRDGKYQLVADALGDEELVLDAPFEIRLPARDLAP